MKTVRNILIDGPPRYDFMTATVAQGLAKLGKKVFGYTEHNYCGRWDGQFIDMVVRTCFAERHFPEVDYPYPTAFVWGDDVPVGTDPCSVIPWGQIKADAYFVRDLCSLAGDGRPENVYPMNFGIEDRYYCVTERQNKPLSFRTYDVVFLGRWGSAPHRPALLTEIRDRLSRAGLKTWIGETEFNEPDGVWSKTANGYCTHDPRYYEVLADSRIILSPHGMGPDCGRSWEAFASGGIPLIQRMNTVMVPPGPKEGADCLFFDTAEDAVRLITETLAQPKLAQDIADAARISGILYHTTRERAKYILDTMNEIL